MLKELINLANRLDKKGFHKEAGELDSVISKLAHRITKVSADDQHGAFQHFQSSVLDYDNRDRYTLERGGDGVDREDLYNVFPEQEAADNVFEEASPSLSTRYSPDRVGVQARRISDGVYQDPYTNKIYDYGEGFKRENGDEFVGGKVDNQSKLYPM